MTLPPPFLRWSAKVSVVNAYVKHNFFGPLTRIISNNIVICSKLENTKKNWLRERILICCFKNTVFECFAKKYRIWMFCQKIPYLNVLQKNATVNKNTGVICAKYKWVVCCMEELQWGLDKVRLSCFLLLLYFSQPLTCNVCAVQVSFSASPPHIAIAGHCCTLCLKKNINFIATLPHCHFWSLQTLCLKKT